MRAVVVTVERFGELERLETTRSMLPRGGLSHQTVDATRARATHRGAHR